MTNPNALYEDMETLNMLYEELCWSHEEELEFKADYENNRIIIQIKKTK
ncbi:gp212 [Synechococcus phage S-CAM8]|nr:gp212 [Synechococcus phage S-CAM8]